MEGRNGESPDVGGVTSPVLVVGRGSFRRGFGFWSAPFLDLHSSSRIVHTAGAPVGLTLRKSDLGNEVLKTLGSPCVYLSLFGSFIS